MKEETTSPYGDLPINPYHLVCLSGTRRTIHLVIHPSQHSDKGLLDVGGMDKVVRQTIKSRGVVAVQPMILSQAIFRELFFSFFSFLFIFFYGSAERSRIAYP